MPKPKVRAATYADIEALAPNMVGQILFGVLHAHPRPTARHINAEGQLYSELNMPFGRGRGGPGGWILLVEPELHLDAHIVVPDIAAWRLERMPEVPNTAFIELPPDWVCEVLSPSTQAIDRTHKLTVYAAYGVKHCWYVDPAARTLEVLVLMSEGKWQIGATFIDADAVTAPPFEAHTFTLDVLWGPKPPKEG